MRFLLTILSIFLLDPSYCQQLIDLKSFRGNNVKNHINAHAPFDVFVSATSDDAEVLSRIHLVTQDKQNQTFLQLKNRKPFLTTSQIQPFPVQTSAYITTNLTDEEMNQLTGMMFISTTNQLQINNFHVIDIDKPQTLYLPNENQTVLFLNSNMETSPFQYTTISCWNQSSDSSIFFYKGIPTDSPQKNYSFIFSNPVSVGGTKNSEMIYLPNVEKFSLGLGAFYIKYYGGISFQVAPEYYDVNGSSTQAFTTTGFYMKAINQKNKTIMIQTARNSGHPGKLGANVVGSMPDNGKVTVGECDKDKSSQTSLSPADQIQRWTSNYVGDVFQISSTNGTLGEYFVQYYVIQEESMETTTKSARSYYTTTIMLMTFVLFLF